MRSYIAVGVAALVLVLAVPAGAQTAASPTAIAPAKRKPKPPHSGKPGQKPPESVPLYGLEPGATKPLGIPEAATP